MIFSYFLIIRWDPPKEDIAEPILEESFADSEYLQSNKSKSPNADFANDLALSTDLCEDIKKTSIETPLWSLELDLNNAEFVKAELKEFPTEIDSNNGKILFNKCGPENYSHKSGFAFVDKSLKFGFNNFVIARSYIADKKKFIIYEKTENSFLLRKTLSYSESDYFIDIEDSIFNRSSEIQTLAPYSKIDRANIDLLENSSIFNPASFAYLGPAFQTSADNYEKISFGDIKENNFRQVSDKGWVSMIEHYFITAIIPTQGDNLIYQAKKGSVLNTFSAGVVGTTGPLLPGENRTFRQKVYFGPKIKQ